MPPFPLPFPFSRLSLASFLPLLTHSKGIRLPAILTPPLPSVAKVMEDISKKRIFLRVKRPRDADGETAPALRDAHPALRVRLEDLRRIMDTKPAPAPTPTQEDVPTASTTRDDAVTLEPVAVGVDSQKKATVAARDHARGSVKRVPLTDMRVASQDTRNAWRRSRRCDLRCVRVQHLRDGLIVDAVEDGGDADAPMVWDLYAVEMDDDNTAAMTDEFDFDATDAELRRKEQGDEISVGQQDWHVSALNSECAERSEADERLADFLRNEELADNEQEILRAMMIANGTLSGVLLGETANPWTHTRAELYAYPDHRKDDEYDSNAEDLSANDYPDSDDDNEKRDGGSEAARSTLSCPLNEDEEEADVMDDDDYDDDEVGVHESGSDVCDRDAVPHNSNPARRSGWDSEEDVSDETYGLYY